MKSFLFLTLLLLAPTISFGQTLFFDDLNTATWRTTNTISDSILIQSKQISLDKVSYPLLPLEGDAAIWTFRDGILTIENFNDDSLEKISAYSYSYEVGDDQILRIFIDNDTSIAYSVGIVSTGFHAILFKQRK